MGEQMKFPNTFKEFAEQYKIVDTKEIYSNGIEFIPIFRAEQWLEYTSAVEMATFESVIDSLEQQLATAKAEAYKECLEKIEQRDVSESDFYIMVKKTEFDNLLKELVGEDK